MMISLDYEVKIYMLVVIHELFELRRHKGFSDALWAATEIAEIERKFT